MIVSDLDGSLLNSRGEISGRTVEALRKYHALGGLFTYATGRSDESAKPFAERAGVSVAGIAFNGGKVVSHLGGKVIYETFMDEERSKKAYVALRAINKNVIVYLDKSRYVAEYTPVVDKYLERVRQGVKIIRDIDQVIGGGGSAGSGGGSGSGGGRGSDAVNGGDAGGGAGGRDKIKKLLVIDPLQEEDLILDTVRPIFGELLNCVKSDPQYYELLPPGTTKGRALEALASHLGIGLNETIAIGDHLNDVSMIEAAGLGVAVANAEQAARDAAGYITASNDDDGVALLIEKLIQGELMV